MDDGGVVSSVGDEEEEEGERKMVEALRVTLRRIGSPVPLLVVVPSCAV